MQTKWQHVAVKVETRKEIDAVLKKYSQAGWELVAVTALHGTRKERGTPIQGVYDVQWFQWDLFFKRPVAE